MITTATWYLTVNKARIDNYKNFYKNYDAEADFERMKVNAMADVHVWMKCMFG